MNDQLALGSVVSVSDDLDVDESDMSFTLPFADGRSRDGVGDLLDIGGIDTSRHELNPVCLFEHGKSPNHPLPIGLCKEPGSGEYSVLLDCESKQAAARVWMYQGGGEHGTFCEQLFHLIADGFIKGGSIGYQMIHGLPMPDGRGHWLKNIHMLECSVVAIPANQMTVRKSIDDCESWTEQARTYLSRGRLCGAALSPVLAKSLMTATRGTWVPVNEHECEWQPPMQDRIKAVRRKYQVKNLADSAAKQRQQVAKLAGAVEDLQIAVDPVGMLQERGEAQRQHIQQMNALIEQLGRII